jgi:hypothetical protein
MAVFDEVRTRAPMRDEASLIRVPGELRYLI